MTLLFKFTSRAFEMLIKSPGAWLNNLISRQSLALMPVYAEAPSEDKSGGTVELRVLKGLRPRNVRNTEREIFIKGGTLLIRSSIEELESLRL